MQRPFLNVTYESKPKVRVREQSVDHTNNHVHYTFPNATDVVAMSRTKLSPSFPGAATQIGLVPKMP